MLKVHKEIPFENEIPASLWSLQSTGHGFGQNPVNHLKVYTLTYVVCSRGFPHWVCVYSPLLTQSLLYITCT